MPSLPEAAVGAVIAALVAGFISLLGLIISKEQKISEFRQAWIDGLRDDSSATIAHAHNIHGAVIAGSSDNTKTWEFASSDFIGINIASTRIQLRLNPSEPQAKLVLAILEEHLSLFSPTDQTPDSSKLPDFSKLPDLDRRIIRESQILLKQEWDRVKLGEPIYQNTKRLAYAIVTVSAIVLVWRICLSYFLS
jgi:hypothetical protein